MMFLYRLLSSIKIFVVTRVMGPIEVILKDIFVAIAM